MSTIDSKFRQQFFHGTRADLAHGDLIVPGYKSNFGEGKTYLGSVTVTTNGSGNASFNATLSVPVTVGAFVTATATSSTANTSEFSHFLTVTS